MVENPTNLYFQAAIDKKRRGARKKVMEMRAGGGSAGGTLHSASSSIVGSQVETFFICLFFKARLAKMKSRELHGFWKLEFC